MNSNLFLICLFLVCFVLLCDLGVCALPWACSSWIPPIVYAAEENNQMPQPAASSQQGASAVAPSIDVVHFMGCHPAATHRNFCVDPLRAMALPGDGNAATSTPGSKGVGKACTL